MGVTANVVRAIRERVAGWPAEPNSDLVNSLLRLLGQWRSIMLANTYVSLEGARIWGGPFAGMEYVDTASEGALIPRLLGTYESELHPHLAAIAADGVDCVIDVGCAEGYYAVGLARMMPGVTVHAHDIDETARRLCADLARRNGVSDRVKIGGEFRPEDFQAFAGRRVLVMVDTEGAEVDILRPDLGPALAGMNIIVETHDVFRPDALETLRTRFASTHDIVQVDTGVKALTGPPWLLGFSHMDQLLAVWEWRLRPTPWLIMRPKAG
jgi:hypothetical protein